MAAIGMLGDIVFIVSRDKVKTFDDMKWDSSAQWAKHNRHLKDVLLEFTGTDEDKISFSMYFSVFLGVNPIEEIAKLLTAERDGKVMRLIIGKKAYGKNKWVIDKTGKALERFDDKGNLLTAKITVSLLAYPNR